MTPNLVAERIDADETAGTPVLVTVRCGAANDEIEAPEAG